MSRKITGGAIVADLVGILSKIQQYLHICLESLYERLPLVHALCECVIHYKCGVLCVACIQH